MVFVPRSALDLEEDAWARFELLSTAVYKREALQEYADQLLDGVRSHPRIKSIAEKIEAEGAYAYGLLDNQEDYS